MRVAYLNQDAGIHAGDQKGAVVHVESMRRALRELGAEVVPIDEKDPRSAARALERSHELDRIDLVFERYSVRGRVGADFAARNDVPLVLEVNAPLLDEARVHRSRPVGADDVAFERAVFESATSILAVSSEVGRYVLQHGLAPQRVLVRPNAVDAQRFAPLPDRERARRDLGIDDRIVLGFHGRLRPWHGFERIVSVAARLREEGIPVHVLTVGAGEFEKLLSARLPRAAFTSLGWIEHASLPRIVGCFDALALGYPADAPCYFSPLKLLEAMAVGAVPIVPALGDLPGIVRHGWNGLVYRASDDDMLFAALERVAMDGALRARLARQALRTARRHSWKSLAYEVTGFAMRAPHGR